jgi:hypothetical protein
MDVPQTPQTLMSGSDPATPPVVGRTRATVYLLVVLLGALGGYAYKLRTDGIFSCSAAGYSSDRYLAYCNATGYGEYDHGAFWFDMESGIGPALARAELVLLGNSRLQYAFSNDVARRWFESNSIPYYLLGFAANENSVFEGEVLRKYGVRGKVYIINADRFFDDIESVPARPLLHDSVNEWRRYEQLKLWQYPHQYICGNLPGICGTKAVIYRSREFGSWTTHDLVAYNVTPVSDAESTDESRWSQYVAIGERFLAELPVDRQCVLLTIVPTVQTKRAEAMAIGDRLGLKVISPQMSDLTTWDGSHLDKPSAARWVIEFLKEAGPLIQACAVGSSPDQMRPVEARDGPT